MLLSKPYKAAMAGCALLVQPIAAMPALAAEPGPLDDAVLRKSIAPTAPAKPGERNARPGELSPIVRTSGAELSTITPEPPLGLTLRPAHTDLPAVDPTTNLVFSGTLTAPGGAVRP